MTKVDHEGHTHDYDVPSHAEVTHDPVELDREIQYHQLVWMGVGLLVTALVSGVIVFFLLRGLMHWRDKQEAPPPVVSSAPTEISGPKLLAAPPRQLEETREAEKEQLESYGWVDQKAGLARIPIERAIDIAAEKGLPNVSSGTAAPAAAPAAVAPAAPAAAPASAAAPAAPTAPAKAPAAGGTPG